MGDKTFLHLENLGSGRPYGHLKVRSSFLRELAYLECLGYIRYKPPLEGLDDLRQFEEGGVLPEHIELTDRGKEFLALRAKDPGVTLRACR